MNLDTHFAPPLTVWPDSAERYRTPATRAPVSTAFQVHRMKFGEHLFLDERVPDETADHPRTDQLHLVRSSERTATLDIPAGWISVVLPLGGLLRARSADLNWQLRRGRMLAWNGALQIKAGNGSGWIVLCGPPESWCRAGADTTAVAEILPEEQPCARELFRLLIRLVRSTGRPLPDISEVSSQVSEISTTLQEQQRPLRNLLPRCAGRTFRGKHRTLLRLLRVQHLIRTQLDRHHDMVWLSKQVNYSVWHLTRVYRAVFDETPSDYATRLRLDRSLQLVRHSALAFCDITEAAGFESQSSFCRAFKKVYAMTPSAVRAQYRESVNAGNNR
ncbi:helix-turn-helix transcriptional regulator [Pseudoxanthomonas sp. UTMC 1351]|uniref:helix-turn-helix transcriptional regulator n=1 Tax=Pseudoxanthomonas sp. UTMC 1351 TaxID=2695853 RepID=UPI0034CF000D